MRHGGRCGRGIRARSQRAGRLGPAQGGKGQPENQGEHGEADEARDHGASRPLAVRLHHLVAGERAAHDINYQALAGLLRPPALPGPLVGDIGAAMQAATRIVAALFERSRTGLGSTVVVSIHEAALDWRRPAEALARQVRAFDPFPGGAGTLEDGSIVKIWAASAVAASASPPTTSCSCSAPAR